MIEFIGKSLLVDKKILVLSDLHLGYGGALENSGVMIPVDVYNEIFRELEEIFGYVKKVKMVVLLGDVKHDMGKILRKEWVEIVKLFDYLKEKCQKIIIVKGNHDNVIEPLIGNRNILLKDVFLWKKYAFFHGNKDFEEIYDAKVNIWILGHLHPAVTLVSGVKSERYKCFLDGKYKGKRIIIMPSFFPFNVGTDLRYHGLSCPWDFNIGSFIVRVVGENLKVLDFRKLKNISSF